MESQTSCDPIVSIVIEARDTALRSDILRYELDQSIQAWGWMLAGYLALVESTADAVSA